MSEKHRSSHENKNTHESQKESHEHKDRLKAHHEKAQSAEHAHQKNIESIQDTIESIASSSKESQITSESTPKEESYTPGSELRTLSFNRTMLSVRKHLKPTEKRLSKVMHQPVIEKSSEIASQTLFRPTGLVFGSICMLLGSVFLLFMSRRYGFSYNYLAGLLLLAAGYLVGCVIEFVLFLSKRVLLNK